MVLKMFANVYFLYYNYQFAWVIMNYFPNLKSYCVYPHIYVFFCCHRFLNNFVMLISPVNIGKGDFYMVNNVENLLILTHILIINFIIKNFKCLHVVKVHFIGAFNFAISLTQRNFVRG